MHEQTAIVIFGRDSQSKCNGNIRSTDKSIVMFYSSLLYSKQKRVYYVG